jgi:hypothetical protein
MNITVLLAKLIEVERSIGVESETMLRKRLYEAEDYALQMQKEMAERLPQRSRQLVSSFRALGEPLRSSSE